MAPLIALIAQNAEIDAKFGEAKNALEYYAQWAVFFAITAALVLLLVGAATGEIPRGAIVAAMKRPLIIGVLLGGGLWIIVTWVITTGNSLLSSVLG